MKKNYKNYTCYCYYNLKMIKEKKKNEKSLKILLGAIVKFNFFEIPNKPSIFIIIINNLSIVEGNNESKNKKNKN